MQKDERSTPFANDTENSRARSGALNFSPDQTHACMNCRLYFNFDILVLETKPYACLQIAQIRYHVKDLVENSRSCPGMVHVLNKEKMLTASVFDKYVDSFSFHALDTIFDLLCPVCISKSKIQTVGMSSLNT